MGWQDRRYNQQVNFGGNPYSHPIARLFLGSVYIGRLFETRIRIHASLLWYIGLTLVFAGAGWKDAAISCSMLFGLVFLHEFGHIFACRSVGGDADEILMWMLGGLAFAGAPRRPWPQFVTIAGGPLVNVIIGVILTAVIYFGYHAVPPMNPLFPFVPSILHEYFSKNPESAYLLLYKNPSGYYIFWLYSVNFSLLFFNLIPMFPLDGGQLLQAILWKPLGYIKSMKFACYLGMVMAVLVGMFAALFAPFLLFIAFFAFFGSLQQLRMVQMMGVEEDAEPYDLSAAWDNPDKPQHGKKKHGKSWFKAARKQALKEQAEQAKIDAILDKVKEKGLHSLTWWEKRTLKKATERQRDRDLAERR